MMKGPAPSRARKGSEMLALRTDPSAATPSVPPTSAVPDALADLAHRAAGGDDRAATELVRRLAPRVSRVVRSLGVPARAHEDVVQDVLVAVVRSLPRFEGRSRLESWVYGICVHVIRHHRRASTRFWRALQAFWSSTREHDAGVADPVEAGRRARAVLRVLDRMPAGRRDVLVLFEMEGRSGAEVAEILGIAEGAVYTRLHHARNAFRRLVAESPELQEELT